MTLRRSRESHKPLTGVSGSCRPVSPLYGPKAPPCGLGWSDNPQGHLIGSGALFGAHVTQNGQTAEVEIFSHLPKFVFRRVEPIICSTRDERDCSSTSSSGARISLPCLLATILESWSDGLGSNWAVCARCFAWFKGVEPGFQNPNISTAASLDILRSMLRHKMAEMVPVGVGFGGKIQSKNVGRGCPQRQVGGSLGERGPAMGHWRSLSGRLDQFGFHSGHLTGQQDVCCPFLCK